VGETVSQRLGIGSFDNSQSQTSLGCKIILFRKNCFLFCSSWQEGEAMLRVLILLFAMVFTVSPVHGKSAEPGWGVGYGTPSEAKSISLDADAASFSNGRQL